MTLTENHPPTLTRELHGNTIQFEFIPLFFFSPSPINHCKKKFMTSTTSNYRHIPWALYIRTFLQSPPIIAFGVAPLYHVNGQSNDQIVIGILYDTQTTEVVVDISNIEIDSNDQKICNCSTLRTAINRNSSPKKEEILRILRAIYVFLRIINHILKSIPMAQFIDWKNWNLISSLFVLPDYTEEKSLYNDIRLAFSNMSQLKHQFNLYNPSSSFANKYEKNQSYDGVFIKIHQIYHSSHFILVDDKFANISIVQDDQAITNLLNIKSKSSSMVITSYISDSEDETLDLKETPKNNNSSASSFTQSPPPRIRENETSSSTTAIQVKADENNDKENQLKRKRGRPKLSTCSSSQEPVEKKKKTEENLQIYKDVPLIWISKTFSCKCTNCKEKENGISSHDGIYIGFLNGEVYLRIKNVFSGFGWNSCKNLCRDVEMKLSYLETPLFVKITSGRQSESLFISLRQFKLILPQFVIENHMVRPEDFKIYIGFIFLYVIPLCDSFQANPTKSLDEILSDYYSNHTKFIIRNENIVHLSLCSISNINMVRNPKINSKLDIDDSTKAILFETGSRYVSEQTLNVESMNNINIPTASSSDYNTPPPPLIWISKPFQCDCNSCNLNKQKSIITSHDGIYLALVNGEIYLRIKNLFSGFHWNSGNLYDGHMKTNTELSKQMIKLIAHGQLSLFIPLNQFKLVLPLFIKKNKKHHLDDLKIYIGFIMLYLIPVCESWKENPKAPLNEILDHYYSSNPIKFTIRNENIVHLSSYSISNINKVKNHKVNSNLLIDDSTRVLLFEKGLQYLQPEQEKKKGVNRSPNPDLHESPIQSSAVESLHLLESKKAQDNTQHLIWIAKPLPCECNSCNFNNTEVIAPHNGVYIALVNDEVYLRAQSVFKGFNCASDHLYQYNKEKIDLNQNIKFQSHGRLSLFTPLDQFKRILPQFVLNDTSDSDDFKIYIGFILLYLIPICESWKANPNSTLSQIVEYYYCNFTKFILSDENIVHLSSQSISNINMINNQKVNSNLLIDDATRVILLEKGSQYISEQKNQQPRYSLPCHENVPLIWISKPAECKCQLCKRNKLETSLTAHDGIYIALVNGEIYLRITNVCTGFHSNSNSDIFEQYMKTNTDSNQHIKVKAHGTITTFIPLKLFKLIMPILLEKHAHHSPHFKIYIGFIYLYLIPLCESWKANPEASLDQILESFYCKYHKRLEIQSQNICYLSMHSVSNINLYTESHFWSNLCIDDSIKNILLETGSQYISQQQQTLTLSGIQINIQCK
jgi:hypothetical protein